VKKKLTIFTFKLISSLVIASGLQIILFNQVAIQLDFKLLALSNLLNFLLAFLIVVVLSIYINKLKSYIGFLFMFGSLLKFAVFFIWFYPVFKMDGAISSFEFSIFFVPYSISLLFETLELGKMLNEV